MKKYWLLFLLSFLILVLPVFSSSTSQNCQPSVLVSIDTFALTPENDVSKYQYSSHYYFKEQDKLFIKNITIINDGECDLPLTQFKFEMIKDKQKLDKGFCESGWFSIPKGQNKTYNGACAIRLSEVGTYYINFSMNGDYYPLPSYLFMFNKQPYLPPIAISVKSINDIKTLEATDRSVWVAIIIGFISIIVGIITICYAKKTYEDSKKSDAEQIVCLKEVATNIDKATDRQLKAQGVMALYARIDRINSFIFETQANMEIIKEIKNQMDSYKKGELVQTERFSILCLENILINNDIGNIGFKTEATSKLFHLLRFYVVLNNKLELLLNCSPQNRKITWREIDNDLLRDNNLNFINEVNTILGDYLAELQTKLKELQTPPSSPS